MTVTLLMLNFATSANLANALVMAEHYILSARENPESLREPVLYSVKIQPYFWRITFSTKSHRLTSSHNFH